MSWPEQSPARTRQELPRLVLLLALVLAATAMLRLSAVSLRTGPAAQRDPAAAEAVFLGDVLYRLGNFVEDQSTRRPDVSWYAGYVLEQEGMAKYERHAFGAHADPEALLRLGMIYSRSGYPSQGAADLLLAGQSDSTHYPLYVRLADLYGARQSVPADLPAARELLQREPRWLGLMLAYDLAQTPPPYPSPINSGGGFGSAQAAWQASLDHFGLALVAAGLVIFALTLAGAIMILLWLLRRLLTLPVAHYRSPWRVPWGPWEALEALVVIFFLLAVLRTLTSLLEPLLSRGAQGGLAQTAWLALLFVVYLALALAFPYSRAQRGGGPPWRLLGLRPLPSPPGVAPAPHTVRMLKEGLRAYALFWALAILPLKYYAGHFLATTSPVLGPGQSAWTYAIDFVILCVLAPVVEEILFRGFFYAGLRRVLPVGSSAVLSALAFAGVHFPAGALEFAFLAALGVVLALLYEHTRSLWPGIALHILHNALIFGIMLAVLVL